MTDTRIGNNFCELRSRHGSKKLFETPNLLWEAACEYFQWIKENPLQETKVFHVSGQLTKTEVPLLRAITR